jgi:hypothetical protein
MKTYKPGGAGASTPQHATNETNYSYSSNGAADKQVEPFPLHCLPHDIQAMARAICASNGSPEALAGCSVLAALSCSLGAGLEIKSGPDQSTRGNLYIMPSGESASGKSKAFNHALKPFLDVHNERKELWKTEVLPRLETDKETLEDDIRELRDMRKKADDPCKRDELRNRIERKKAELKEVEARLHAPKLFTQDVTSQTLGPLLMGQPGECLASLSADARELVDIWLGKYNGGKGTDENFYVQAWTGDVYESDRTTRGNVSLKRPCLAALWLVQRDKLDAMFAERSLLEGGHLARILTCHTNCRPQRIGTGGKPIPTNVSQAYTKLIRTLLDTYRLSTETRTIYPSAEAMRAMNAHFDAIVDRWESGEVKDVGSFALRWTEQAWRIAVCLHAALWGSAAHEQRLELGTAARAMEIADWFAAQQLEILSAGRYAARRKIRDGVLALLADTPKGIRASDVYRARITRNADEAHTLLATMESDKELTGRDEQPEGGRHVTRIFTRARK